jgi:glycolate oxidase FAD binding subunit
MGISAALTLEQGLSYLVSVLGPEHVGLRGQAIVAAPGDTEQIAQVLRFAHENELAVTATGGGTKLQWGNPVAADILLSTVRLNAIRAHAWQDMTCTVEAGCTWSAMQSHLNSHGQMVALDPLWPEKATVGGIVASNDGGALRLKFGGLRDLIIGMTVVLADGTIAKTGGKVVKNVAGYDIHKLMTGSFGTLGVIADVNFRLHPVEAHARTWTSIGPAGNAPVVFDAALRALMNSEMTPSGVQLRTANKDCALDVRIAGLPECFDEYGLRLQAIFGQLEIRESCEDAWQARSRLFDDAASAILKVSALPSEICTVCSELRQWAIAEGLEIIAVATATGLMTVGIGSHGEAAKTIIELVRTRLQASNGSVIALQLPTTLRDSIDVWGSNGNAIPLMREIKRHFDPNRILNPGRFVGNI